MISIFYEDDPKKFIAMFLPLDSTSTITRPIIKPKQKHGNEKLAKFV